VTPQPDSTYRFRRRLWVERIVLVVLIAVFLTLYLVARSGGGRACLISVNGQTAAVVANRAEAERLLQQLKAASGLPADKVHFAQQTALDLVSRRHHRVLGDAEAARALSTRLDTVIEAAAVLADGRIVFGLPDQNEAVSAISLFLEALSPPGDDITRVFKQQVKVELRDVPTQQYFFSARGAVNKMVEGATPRHVHEVKPGDTAWEIASHYHLSLSGLAVANPALDLNRIRPGDQLKIPGDPLPVTVIAKQDVQELVTRGLRHRTQTVRITYENGVEVSRRVIGRQPLAPSASPEAPPDRASRRISEGEPR
jgi:LysM repeat protein